MSGTVGIITLPVQEATAAALAPFGTLIEPGADALFGPADARLRLNGGTPRLSIMRLQPRGLGFAAITRHAAVTQCLAALGGREWFVGLAPPDAEREEPDPAAIAVFRIPGTVALALHTGTWHAGPLFAGPACDFLNLELADTNEADHHTCHLGRRFGATYAFTP